jgi:uncharacterized integral membrane protein
MLFSLVIGLILCLLALIFALQNTQSVQISFLIWQNNSSLALILIIFFIVGLFTGILVMLPARIRSALAMAKKNKELTDIETKLAEGKSKLE